MLSRFMQVKITNANSFKWICFVKTVLIKCGLVNIWDNQSIPYLLWLKKTVCPKLSDLFINNWYLTINMSRKCINYRIYKNTFGFEEYMRNTPTKCLKYIIKFRTRNNRLSVEVGCWTNINYEVRKCKLCHSNCVGDEFHDIL